MLSIFLGIMTIFIFVSFGLGLYSYTQGIIAGSSADKIIIQPKGGILGGPGTFKLDDNDLKAIEKTPGVIKATGVYLGTGEVKQGETLKYVFVIGYDPKESFFVEAFNMKLSEGRELRSGEIGKVVLGSNYATDKKIFPKSLTLNNRLNLLNKKVKIIGFYKSVGNAYEIGRASCRERV